MLNNLRNPIPGIENASEAVKKTAMSAAQAAKDATGQLEDWAKDSYGSARDAVKTKPFMLGAASLGFGALMGGLYALWQGHEEQWFYRETKTQKKQARRFVDGRLTIDARETSRRGGANREAASQNLARL